MVTGPRASWIAAARVANAAFFLATATYCLLTYSSFAYQQFVKPHLVMWLSEFVVWHHAGHWVMLGVTGLSMGRELGSRPGRFIGASYLLVATAIGVALLVRPVLPQVENDGRGLVLALIALLLPVWLALYDHRATSGLPAPLASPEPRIFYACVAAGIAVWAAQTLTAPWRLGYAGEIAVGPAAVVFGAATSLALHLLVFTIAALILVGAVRAARSLGVGGAGEYWILAALMMAGTVLVARRLMFGAIAFVGPAAWSVAVVLAALLVLLWSSLARRFAAGRTGESALERLLLPLPGAGSRAAAVAAVLALPLASHAGVARLMTFDWDFLLQRMFVIAVWLAAFGYCYRIVRAAHPRLHWSRLSMTPAAACLLFATHAYAQPRLPGWMGDPRFVPEFTLEGYVAVDPSLRLIRQLLHVDTPEDEAFYRYLQSHSTIQHVELPPVDIDYERPIGSGTGVRPHIFLFVVDSLRQDYLAPYNGAVRFTPAFARFAADATVFERTFTRYGGTGLSMPALWSGGMLIHKQYVTPFGPMNTLEKLLEAHGYRMAMSMDHITELVVKPSASIMELDRGRPEMQYDFCRTLNELSTTLQQSGAVDAPLFAHTRSLNLHVVHVRRTPVPPGRSYEGFVAPVAAAVERIDACFGTFVDYLKTADLYDESILIVTSDHGDALGESLRWGHAQTIVPEVLRIPLIIRVPDRYRAGLRADTASISFSTDITPTLYRLLGHNPVDLGPLFGVPLFASDDLDRSARRQEMFLVASSYGPVYGVLRENGSRLYIADAINSREFAYDMAKPGAPRVGVTPEDRAGGRAFIRGQLDELARIYRFKPRS
jgi:uncharacterized membrane protein